MTQHEAALAVADRIADRLASPAAVSRSRLTRGWWPRSLAVGATGVAMLHVERARAGLGSWQRAHEWLVCSSREPVPARDGSHLYYGAPAIAFVLHAAAAGPDRYARALGVLDRHITADVRRRLDAAHRRIDRAKLPALAEFDTIRGLAGIGAHLLRRDPLGEPLRQILIYLVRLTAPMRHDGDELPGWWTDLAPSGRTSSRFPGGHSNHGLAHGIAGPLALLALAAREGIEVDGQVEAIGRITAWLDQWRQDGPAGSWWPYWITRDELRAKHVDGAGPGRPSWCYGTAGVARAQQLAALATGDTTRQEMAEDTLFRALTDPGQLTAVTDLSLCHGYGGLLHVAQQFAADALTPDVASCLPSLLEAVLAHPGAAELGAAGDVGFLEGAAGVALALQVAAIGAPPVSRWDSCLLIN